ncbi:hypothetical protein SLS60_000473 [Paraconiothyrium brasiliense]|uniref:Uncharacterized protein n=1 Tax=Paraconiothyrium brasiliense TaxID=300254 RepID=A0ABR3S6B8_9PLEO
MIAFHEGEVAYNKNPLRGTQFYPNCVQIEVVSNGTVELPEGPTVWSGAWAETTAVPLSPVTGGTTATPWSTWIQKSVVTSASFSDKKTITVAGTSTYEEKWSTTYQTPAPGTRRW